MSKARPEINHYDEIPDTMSINTKKKKEKQDMPPFPVA
jgi:hypothetical protein